MAAAYEENGKWFKRCTTTKQVFGGVDTVEELGEWFGKQNDAKDGFRYACREAEKQRKKQDYQKNADKIKERSRQYDQQNPEKKKERNRQYYQENPEKQRERKRKYSQTPAGLLCHYKKSAKRRKDKDGKPKNFTLTLEWFEEQSKLPEFNVCAITGITFVQEANHPFARSLDRVSSTKGYTPDNVRWVCHRLNSWKSDLKLEEIALIVKYMCDKFGYDPVEYMREIAKGNNNPHLSLVPQAAK